MSKETRALLIIVRHFTLTSNNGENKLFVSVPGGKGMLYTL